MASKDSESRYDVGDEIAQGGMGEVKDARDLHLDRAVALKLIREDRGVSSDVKQRFVQEARILARLEHPNIIPIHDLDKDHEGRVFYTMKKVQGLNLKQVLDGIRKGDAEMVAKHSLSQLLNVFQKVCDAMAYAHSRGIIHRDLKPENIMLGEFGEVWVMDWGLAKVLADGHLDLGGHVYVEGADSPSALAGDPALTMDGAVMGTPQFMAPEQAEGRVADQDERTDIFALGGILYSILTLRAPTSGSSLEEILDNIKSGYIPPPIIYNRSKKLLPGGEQADAPILLSHCPGGRAPEALSAVTMTAMEVEPENRYQSVEELQAEIRAFQGGFATSVEEAGALRQLVLFVRRNRTFSAMTAIIFLLIAGSMATWIRGETRNQAQVRNLKIAGPLLEANIAAKIASRDFATALNGVEDLLMIESDSAKNWNQKGNILLAQLEFDEAATAYARSLELDAGHADSRESLALCRALVEGGARGVPGEGELKQLTQLMSGQSRFALAETFRERLVVNADDRAKQVEIYRAALLEKGVPESIVNGLRIQTDTNLKFTKPSLVLQLEGANIDSLAPFRGIPIEGINIASTRITDLSPVKGMPLRGININYTRINDLSPLRGMALEYLRAYFGNLSDLASLEKMPLKFLYLQGNHEIKDLSPLASLTSLRELHLSENKVTDIRALRDLPLLTTVHIHRMPVTDFSPLQGKSIHQLGASQGPIADIEFVKGMPLTNLFLYSSDKITDFSPLKTLTKLQGLDATSTQISDLSVLAGLPLQGLGLSGCAGVTDLTPLQGMPLKTLALQSSKVVDLAPLAGMPLTDLNIHITDVRDLTPLANMPLRTLGIANTQVRDLSPLRGMPLTRLSMHDVKAADLSPLKGMPLQFLEISRMPVVDLAPLEGMPLTTFQADGIPAADFDFLRGMKLTEARLDGTKISNLSVLEGMPLGMLTLSACGNLRDVSPLASLQLTELHLNGCSLLRDVSPMAQCSTLERLTLPVNVKGIEALRDHPKLRKLAYQLPSGGDWSKVPAIAEFWKAYDARKKR